MNIAAVYLLHRVLFRIIYFFRHWYVDASRIFARRFIVATRSLNATFAVGITLRHFFEPLYKDYTPVGMIAGPIFRTGRVIIGCLAYLFVLCLFLLIYIVWVAIPVALLAKIAGIL